jgi:uncharacterized protein YuzE
MRLTYDPRFNIANILFHEKSAQVESIRLSDEVVVDMAPDGTIYGIELLNTNEQLRGEGTTSYPELVIEATGERSEQPLPVGE